jgi:tetrahydromethanopterin S-methyltransferase subunit D
MERNFLAGIMGGTLGGAYGIISYLLFTSMGLHPPAFAVAAMAGMGGGTNRCRDRAPGLG